MSGPPVSLGCAVMLSPGASGPPDVGVIVAVTHATATADGLPLATSGSICQMVNSITGAPYPLPIGAVGSSTGVLIEGNGLVRMGDVIPSGSGVLQILGPPASPVLIDGNAP